jgi:hypothetical protein
MGCQLILILSDARLIMSYVRIIDLTSSPNLDRISATLSVARINDSSGLTTTNPHEVAKGELNIAPLIALNHQVTENFKQATCQNQYYGGIQIPDKMICQVANLTNGLRADVRQLQQELEETLAQQSWSNIREELIDSLGGIDPQETVRLVVRTDDLHLQALPIECTSFITDRLMKDGRSVSVVFAPRSMTSQQQLKKLVWQDLPKVLLVLGSQRDIEKPISHDEIEGYFPSSAIVKLLANPSPENLLKTIADGIYDVIIIVGHSHANDSGFDGRIKINDELDRNSVSIGELTQPFKSRIKILLMAVSKFRK